MDHRVNSFLAFWMEESAGPGAFDRAMLAYAGFFPRDDNRPPALSYIAA